VADPNALPTSSSSGGGRTLIVVVGLVIAVVLAIIIIHAVQHHLHNSHELSVYDKCLNEPYPDGPDCQTIIHDCANGDSYACHLESVLACIGNSGSGCNNTGSTMAPPWRREFALG
jgi:hypothetical protein